MDKSPDAFRTISEVAEDLDLPQHVLRFWETRFNSIRPLKRGGGRRYYRPDDVDLLKGIRHLLYGQGYTIKGVQRILKEDGLRFVQAIGRGEQTVGPGRKTDASDEPSEAELEETDEEAVEELADAEEVSAGEEVAADAAPPSRNTGRTSKFGSEDVARLRSALDELVECQRILGTLAAE